MKRRNVPYRKRLHNPQRKGAIVRTRPDGGVCSTGELEENDMGKEAKSAKG
jgi:hypothetical protein